MPDNHFMPTVPDDLLIRRFGAIGDILKAMCDERSDEGRFVYDALLRTFRTQPTARLRHLPYWVQILFIEAESIRADAEIYGVPYQAVIAYRSESRGYEASALRHWFTTWIEKQSADTNDDGN